MVHSGSKGDRFSSCMSYHKETTSSILVFLEICVYLVTCDTNKTLTELYLIIVLPLLDACQLCGFFDTGL